MAPAQIRHMHDAGVEIGAHTVTHPILSSIGEEEARGEIVASKRRLQEITGAPVPRVRLPERQAGPGYGPEHVRLMKEARFLAALSAVDGVAHSGSDPYQLPRFGLYDRSPLRLGSRMLAKHVRPMFQ